MTKYIAVPDELISNGAMSPVEAIFYCRIRRFYLNCKEANHSYFIDQLTEARFFRVSRKTIRAWIRNLEVLGLLQRTGTTAAKQGFYCVVDWQAVEQATLNDTERKALNDKYDAERKANAESYKAYVETQEATQERTEAPQSVETPVIHNDVPEEEKTPQNSIESVLEACINKHVFGEAARKALKEQLSERGWCEVVDRNGNKEKIYL